MSIIYRCSYTDLIPYSVPYIPPHRIRHTCSMVPGLQVSDMFLYVFHQVTKIYLINITFLEQSLFRVEKG